MLCFTIQNHSVCLLLMVSINLVHHISVTESQSTSKRNQILGVNKNIKDKQNVTTSAPKVKKDIESETQRAIEDDFETEVTTLAVNQTIDHILNESEINSTLNQTLINGLILNQTEIITPSLSSNVTTNDSLVSIIDETPEYINSTEYELLLNLTTLLSTNSINDTTLTPNITENITNSTDSTESYLETVIEVTDTLHESSILSSTVSAIEALTDSNIDFKEEVVKCVFDNQIQCKNYELMCFGSGEVDCGVRGKRSAQNLTENSQTDSQVYKLYLEKQSLSETIKNSECVLTAFEKRHFSCHPIKPLTEECSGRSICKPTEDESTDLSEGMPFWKVGLIAALTAIGFICFIIVAVIAYVSYNKLKVRPESSTNGYQSNPQNVTRV